MTASPVLSDETLIPLAGVAAVLPGSRGANRIHPATVTRWILSGVRGPNGQRVRLEAVRVGHRWLTSPAAVRRFVAETTAAALPDPTPPPRSPTATRRASDRAEAELVAAGC